MGSKMFFGNLEEEIYGRKGDGKTDLERKLMERMGNYDRKNNEMNMGNMTNNISNIGMYDPMMSMQNQNMYNDEMNRNQKYNR